MKKKTLVRRFVSCNGDYINFSSEITSIKDTKILQESTNKTIFLGGFKFRLDKASKSG